MSPIVLREFHYWYALDLDIDRPRAELGAGLELTPATAANVAGYEELPTISAREAAERIAQGNDGWLVRSGNEVVFGCWIFHDRTPVLAQVSHSVSSSCRRGSSASRTR